MDNKRPADVGIPFTSEGEGKIEKIPIAEKTGRLEDDR
jgi:hypothetical protein